MKRIQLFNLTLVLLSTLTVWQNTAFTQTQSSAVQSEKTQNIVNQNNDANPLASGEHTATINNLKLW